MKTVSIPLENIASHKTELKQGSRDHIRAYFNDSGPDYKAWSTNFNMHFGYFNLKTGFFNREKMLEQMNREVENRLEIPSDKTWKIADMGCGMGATAASIGANKPHCEINGITIVPWQVQMGNALIKNRGLRNTRLHLSDIADPLIPDSTANAAYAVESFCYGDGLGKNNFVSGMSKVLKQNARFVIVDGFCTKPKHKFNPVFRYLYETVCKNWALKDFAEIEAFKEALTINGLEIEKIEDASWRVAPSALQVPVVTARFLWDKLKNGDQLNQLRWGHLKACICGMFMGMFRGHFKYYIISGRKNSAQ